MMNALPDLPDPEARAAAMRKAHQHDDVSGVGAARDTLIEARIEADWMHQRAQRMAVDIDGMMDDLGLFPGDLRAMLHDAQRRMQHAAEWADRFADALEAETERLSEANADG